jgi:dihydropyrimidinase
VPRPGTAPVFEAMKIRNELRRPVPVQRTPSVHVTP